ncbi:NYN domain-containing protein [Allofranklinella schreckenbergeri]|uniref:NYN domain-containing protein n=1 Tax=Allofranklinella schreckenbergeri TaxID=1076744 RepID=A0A3M6QDQ2_9BURK|nr:NYN domain-containing protein [Allofranklinella schreckenbergeri]RMW95088.1 NYN domain-containing protein [Allofranklinella schreckenbergeri]RMX01253.1 NYN domain-containing protein [Allofranklinella schreckenbergeri]RMX07023.1 NYN domain-containing protein [Allofranklinella schreckenbergeri]RRD42213.1 NYN domain-containing protein [Comamonadaceae bacterium OH3737_COT-264]
MPTAILIDGGYFIKRFRAIEPHNKYDASRAADVAFRCALSHLREKDARHASVLYRIFFYDCPPVSKKMHWPQSRKAVDFSKSEEALFRLALHERLRKKRKVALRLGTLSHVEWAMRPGVAMDLAKGRRQVQDVSDEDFELSVRQKGVDMRIGLDIASIAFKKQAKKIVLFAGDSDFVPAAKLARREGIDFVLDPMWREISPDLHEHIDGLRSTIRRPA